MNLLEELKKFPQENKITIVGIVVTFIMSASSLYLQYKTDIELSVIANFYGTTTLGENIEHRLTFINSGNTPISVEHVYASIKKPNGDVVNSKVDIIPPFVIDKKDMEVINLNHILIDKGVRGLHTTTVSFSVIDVNGVIYKHSFDLGKLTIGHKITDGKFKYPPSQKFDLLDGSVVKLKI